MLLDPERGIDIQGDLVRLARAEALGRDAEACAAIADARAAWLGDGLKPTSEAAAALDTTFME